MKRCALPGVILLLIAPTPTAAQPSRQLFGGAGAVVARNASDSDALPSDGHAAKLFVGAVFTRKDIPASFQFELDFPETMTTRVPGSIKSGPIVYVITQRHLVASFLAGPSFAVSDAVHVNGLVGISLVRKDWSIGYSIEMDKPETREDHLAWSGGVDLGIEFRRVVMTLPRLRVRYITGITELPGPGFAPARVLFDAGVAVGWRF